ncbi:hypothetical protein VTG60DRAFT_1052 [Thermothelomyces hinnuleus]
MARRSQFPPQDRFPLLSLGDSSPGSPDSIIMRNFEQSASLNMLSLTQYPAISAPNLDPRELMGGLRFLPSARSQRGFTQHQGMHPLNQFIHGPGPWSPFEAAAGQPVGMSFNQPRPSFTTYRSAPPSEPDTVCQSIGGTPTDSGYGSNARQSVGNPSVQGELEQNFLSRFQAIGQEDASPKDDPHTRETQAQRPSSGAPTSKRMTCPVCNEPVKRRSDLKKHEARHTRPCKCPFPNCPKADEGFATKNDLDRHTKSVHKLLMGVVTVYRCDVDQCKDKPKDWPRLDNFKQHLKRKHGIENADLSRFTFQVSGSDAAGLRPSESAPSGLPTASSSTLTPETLWVGTDQCHVDPASLFRNSHLDQMGNVNPFSSFSSTKERELVTLEIGSLRLSDQNITENPHPVTKSAPFVLGTQRPTMEGARSGTESISEEANQPSCIGIAPDILSQACAAFKPFDQLDAQPRQAQEMASSDAPEMPDVSRSDVLTQVDEVESNIPDDMDVDGSGQDSGSEDGSHDSDSDEDEPSQNPTDSQSNLLRDAGAQYIKVDEAHIKASPSQVELDAEDQRPIDLDDDTQASAVVKSLIEKGKLGEMLKRLGYPALDDLETKGRMPTDLSSTAGDSGYIHKCQECQKPFQRRCELKKHLKRHAKPYACTFLNCNKRFGSKNDWKRHENSQHFQAEIWRCAERPTDRPDQGECGKVCHSRESLRTHLEEDHGIRDIVVLDKRLTDWHMGRNYEFRFWCGFCQKTIESTGKERPAHSQRFDHIDDHLNGRHGLPKADIKDWKHVDTESIESQASPPGKSRRSKGKPMVLAGKARKRGYDGGGDDGSSRSKRLKDGKGMVWFWECCLCHHYWRESIMPKCMNDGCNHECCENCDREPATSLENEPDPEPEVPPSIRDREEDGIMM